MIDEDIYNNNIKDNQNLIKLKKIGKDFVEVIDLKTNNNENKKNVVIVITPGNPGIIRTYKQFILALYNEFNGIIRVIGVGHIGHSNIDYNQNKLYTIEQQIRKTAIFLTDLTNSSKNLSIILMGHSMGAYINLKITSSFPNLPIIYNFYLFPVICKFPNLVIIKCITKPVIRCVVANLVSILPKWFKHKIIKWLVPNLKDEIKEVVINSNTNMIENALFCSNSYIFNLNEFEPSIVNYIEINSNNISFIFTPYDRYVTKDTINYIKMKLPFTKINILKKDLYVKHAFNINGSKIMKDICLSELGKNMEIKELFTNNGYIFENNQEEYYI